MEEYTYENGRFNTKKREGLALSKEEIYFIINEYTSENDKFKEMVSNQNGDVSFVEHPEKLLTAKYTIELPARESGYISKLILRIFVIYSIRVLKLGDIPKHLHYFMM